MCSVGSADGCWQYTVHSDVMDVSTLYTVMSWMSVHCTQGCHGCRYTVHSDVMDVSTLYTVMSWMSVHCTQ